MRPWENTCCDCTVTIYNEVFYSVSVCVFQGARTLLCVLSLGKVEAHEGEITQKHLCCARLCLYVCMCVCVYVSVMELGGSGLVRAKTSAWQAVSQKGSFSEHG